MHTIIYRKTNITAICPYSQMGLLPMVRVTWLLTKKKTLTFFSHSLLQLFLYLKGTHSVINTYQQN